MSLVRISDLAYEKFEKFLQANNAQEGYIRINLSGMSCSGPVFSLVLDEKNVSDLLVPIKDINFLIDSSLVTKFKGFELKCSEKNGTNGFTLEPFIKPESSNCSTCSGCH